MIPTVEDVKKNLILYGDEDDALINSLIEAAVSYAEGFQHLPDGYYTTVPEGAAEPPVMQYRTKQAVIMMATAMYEARDGGTGGYFADSTAAAQQSQVAIDNLLRLDREWRV